MTLKWRIFIIFLCSSLVPLICICLISYYTIYSILSNKIQNVILSNLKQVTLSLENAVDNLNHISQQFAYEGTIGKELDEYIQTDAPYRRLNLNKRLKNELNLLAFTNPGIVLTLYYFQNDDTYQFENFPVKDHFSPKKLPLLAQSYGISYFGPHVSYNRLDNRYVLSALRKVELPERDDVYIYIETGFQLTQNLLDSDQAANQLSYLIVDNGGKVVYSEIPDIFSNGTTFPANSKDQTSGYSTGYYWYKQPSDQG